VLERLKTDVKYEFQQTQCGGRVHTTNAEVLAAVHEFLRFQIEDHRTGGPKEVH
jgi:hypothetical protein